MLEANRLRTQQRIHRALLTECITFLIAINVILIGLISIAINSFEGLIGISIFLLTIEANVLSSFYSLNHSFQPRLPRFGQFLFQMFISKEHRESMLGDLAEDYADIQTKFGARQARVWYYKQALFSILALLRYGLRLSWCHSIARLIGHNH